MINTFIFDLDGVIVDTAKYHYMAWKRLADELGVNFTLDDNEQLKGVSRMASLDIILNLGKISLSEQEKIALTDKKNLWFVDYVNQMTPDEVFPGVNQVISNLKERGNKVGLASSSKNAKAVLNLLKIESLFDNIVDGTMIVHSKPHPEIFLLAAKNLKSTSQECLVFEDAEAGVEAALSASMKCVGIGSPEILNKANIVIPSVKDFNFEMLEEIGSH